MQHWIPLGSKRGISLKASLIGIEDLITIIEGHNSAILNAKHSKAEVLDLPYQNMFIKMIPTMLNNNLFVSFNSGPHAPRIVFIIFPNSKAVRGSRL